tara:strand:+ start:1993 stop:2388 length:396 start_codon:yes stop_codon:yes gene_type:complete
VEEDRHLVCFAVHESDLGSVGSQKNTWAERQKKSGRDSDFLGSDIGEHLVYAHIFFRKVNKMVKGGTPHHLFMKSIIVDNPSESFPDVMKKFFIFGIDMIVVRIVFTVAKLYKVAKLSHVFNMSVIHQRPD